MNIEYYEQYHQKGGNYVIPVEVFNDLLDEHQELNQKYLNAVSDYEEQKFNVEELKKQLEEERDKVREYSYKLCNFRCEETYENQQKEFIEYMNKTIEELECDDVGDEELKGYLIQRIGTFKEILSKHKEIMGKGINVGSNGGKDER